MMVEARCETTGQKRTQTNAVVPTRTREPSVASERKRRPAPPAKCRAPERMAGRLEPTSTSCAARSTAPITTFDQTTPSNVDGTSASTVT